MHDLPLLDAGVDVCAVLDDEGPEAKEGRDEQEQPATRLPITIVLFNRESAITGVFTTQTKKGVSASCVRMAIPCWSKRGSSMKPSGVAMAQPRNTPGIETVLSIATASTTRLCKESSGVRPKARPMAIPIPTWPGVPSEFSALNSVWRNLMTSIRGKLPVRKCD